MSSLRHTINLGNSIIGVSVLAMPYCFKQCGIALTIILIILSGILNRISCHLLMKSAIIARRRNYELLAFDVFGSTGKLIVELSVLGFLLGTCIAFFVVIGDIAPSLVSSIFGVTNGPQLRAFVMTLLAMFIVLPLGLLRHVESLTSFSLLSLALYTFLVIKMFNDASINLFVSTNDVWSQLNYWQTSHILSNLPIISMALSCQTQLFEIFDNSLINSDMSSIKHMNLIISRSINMCSYIYIAVGFFGYIAFFELPFRGNILIFIPSGFVSTLTQIAFVFTVLISFPLCLFPCRTSLHSFLFRKSLHNELVSTSSPSIHMSDQHFRLLTIALIVTTIGMSVMLPHIELVLAFLGSTIGAVICFIFPAMIFLKLTKNSNDILLAKCVAIAGVFILVVCTLTTIHDMYFYEDNHVIINVKPSEVPIVTLSNLNLDADAIKKEEKELKIMAPQNQLSDELTIKSVPVLDANKAKRQEELLQRLEKQQQEHKKLLEQQKEVLNEMKKHNQLHHDLNSNKLVVDSQQSPIINNNSNKSVVSIKPRNQENNNLLNSKKILSENNNAVNQTFSESPNKPLISNKSIQTNSVNKSEAKQSQVKLSVEEINKNFTYLKDLEINPEKQNKQQSNHL